MLKGTLDDFSLADIFRLLSFTHKTGRLEVVRRAGEGEVLFKDGEVYYARSSLSKEPLGQKLVRAGVLGEGQLNKALDLHAQTGKRVGEILVSSGMVTAERIEVAVRQQIEDAAFDLLRWDLGEFSWEADATVAVEVPIAVSVENLVVEAARRLDELEVIKRKIPSADSVLRMAPSPPEGAAEINITPPEWRALVLVDGRRSVAEIGATIGLGELDAMKLLHGLASAGLVELDHDARAGAATPQTPGDPPRPPLVDVAAETAPHVAAPVEDRQEGPARVAHEPSEDPEGRVEGQDDAQPELLAQPEVGVEGGTSEQTEDSFLTDLLGAPSAARRDEGLATSDAPDAAAELASEGAIERHTEALAVTPPASHPAAAAPHTRPEPRPRWRPPEVDRGSIVKELAGLFEEEEAPRTTPAPPTEAAVARVERRRRVEDDEHVTRGLVSRLIKGVKGL